MNDEALMYFEEAHERIALLIEGRRAQEHGRRAPLQAYHRNDQYRSPYLVGVTGSVAVGKSSFCDSLGSALSRVQSKPRIEIVSTDGFLRPNAELAKLGLLETKGSPPTYDDEAFVSFVQNVRKGAGDMAVPLYSHRQYDICGMRDVPLHATDILIVEGLNVLQRTAAGQSMADMFDFSIFVDANVDDVESWYVKRVLTLRRETVGDHNSYHQKYDVPDETSVVDRARRIWRTVNCPIFIDNILPTKDKAHLIVRKGSDHAIYDILVQYC